MCDRKYDYMSEAVTVTTKAYRKKEQGMKDSKFVLLLQKQATPIQTEGDILFFQSPLLPEQHSTAWQGGCYRSPHYNGVCGEETSLIVFSLASSQSGGQSGHNNGVTFSFHLPSTLY